MASAELIHTPSHSSRAAAADTCSERPKLLEGIVTRAISCSRYVLMKARQLPGPMGSAVGVVGDIVGPRLQPIATSLGNRGSCLLLFVDEKLYSIGGTVEQRVPGALVLLRKAHKCHILTQRAAKSLRRRGLVGSVADAWVEYETFVKYKSEEALNLAKTIPLLRTFVPIVQIICVPFIQAGSNWLSRRSEVIDKHPFVSEESGTSDMDEPDADLEEKDVIVFQHSEGSAKFHQPDEKALQESSEGNYAQDTESESSKIPTQETGVGGEVVAPEAPESGGINNSHLANYNSDSDEDEIEKLFHAGWSLKPRRAL